MHPVQVRRAYDAPARGDGARVLVDRPWPRGLTKAHAGIDEWCTAVAPSTALRRWYDHEPARFEEFGRRYRAELAEPAPTEALRHLRDLAAQGTLTLLTATKRVEISAAVVLAAVIRA